MRTPWRRLFLACVSLVTLPLMAWRSYVLSKTVRPIWMQVQENIAEITRIAEEALTGIRVVLVQNIGMVTIAALIGGGGLGTFVFQGIGQTAIDLVLLGAIPIVVLAFSAAVVLDRPQVCLRAPTAYLHESPRRIDACRPALVRNAG